MKRLFFVISTILTLATSALAAPVAEPKINPDGTINAAAFASFSACKASPISAGRTIVVKSALPVNNVTVPATIGVRVEQGGSIDIASGKTATFNGQFEAGRYQVFTGPGRVVLGATNQSLAPVVYPQWWGIVPDDTVTDDTAGFQKMIADIGVTGQAIIDLGEGVYSISSLDLTGYTGGIHFRGTEWVKTYFRITSTTGNVFNLTDSRFVKFTDFGTTPTSSPKTSGSLFYLNHATDTIFRDLRLNGAYNAFNFAGGSTSGTIMENVTGGDYSTHAWEWFFKLSGINSNLTLRNVLFGTANTPTGGGFLFDGPFDTITAYKISAGKMSSAQIPYGLRFTANSGEFATINDSYFECGSTGGTGISVEGGSNIQFSGNHSVTNINGLVISGGNGIQYRGGRLYHNAQNGAKLLGGTDVNINGVTIDDNGFSTNNTYDQVYVAANVSQFNLQSNTIGKHRPDGILPRYGVYVAPGKSEKYNISGNLITDFGTAAIFDGGYVGGTSSWSKINTGNIGGAENVKQIHANVATSSDTPVALWTKTLTDKLAYYITAKVISQYAAGAGAINAYTRSVLVYRDGGGATIVGAVANTETIEYAAVFDCTFAVSGNDVQLLVTGVNGSTDHWDANIEIMAVMDATTWGALP